MTKKRSARPRAARARPQQPTTATNPSPTPASPVRGDPRMQGAYRAAAELQRRLLERDRPDDARLLQEGQVVVVRGVHDHGEAVFDLCGVRATVIDPAQAAWIPLDPEQVLFVNCPGNLDPDGQGQVRKFVEQGGLLVTTDWALTLVAAAFPGLVRPSGGRTGDEVVRVRFEEGAEDGFLEGLLDPQDEPVWWLEGASYPIEVLDPGRVRVLATSEEMQARYRHGAVVVTFDVGEGKVYHLTSHFYLQRAETRSQRQAASGAAYAAQKGIAVEALPAAQQAALKEASVGEVEAAFTSARALGNLVIEQGKRVAARRGARRGAPRGKG